MLEATIEQHLIDRCKGADILCEKFVSPARRNVPDRILTYRSLAVFVELKAPGKKPNPGQVRDHLRRMHNATVVWTDSKEGCDVIVDCIVARRPIPYLPGFKVDTGAAA